MKQMLSIIIECGQKSCASKPKNFCSLLTLGMRGGASCLLFGQLVEENGWIMRHKLCIKYAINCEKRTNEK
jgi:hypothetical protein